MQTCQVRCEPLRIVRRADRHRRKVRWPPASCIQRGRFSFRCVASWLIFHQVTSITKIIRRLFDRMIARERDYCKGVMLFRYGMRNVPKNRSESMRILVHAFPFIHTCGLTCMLAYSQERNGSSSNHKRGKTCVFCSDCIQRLKLLYQKQRRSFFRILDKIPAWVLLRRSSGLLLSA